MRSIVSVSPFRCRMWRLHDRLESGITVESCGAEIESFLKEGQLIPALGRRLTKDVDHDFELIYGARRLFVAQHLNKELLVELCDLSDRDAIVAMDIENRHRADISPYERGMSYARWLRSGLFECQDDIARALKISASQVSRLLQLAKLPTAIVAAFASSADLREGWGLELRGLLDNQKTREETLQRARAIARMSPRPKSHEVYRKLLACAAQGRKVKPKGHDEVVKALNGSPLFRVRFQRKSIALLFPVEKLSEHRLRIIKELVANAMQNMVDANGISDKVVQVFPSSIHNGESSHTLTKNLFGTDG